MTRRSTEHEALVPIQHGDLSLFLVSCLKQDIAQITWGEIKLDAFASNSKFHITELKSLKAFESSETPYSL